MKYQQGIEKVATCVLTLIFPCLVGCVENSPAEMSAEEIRVSPSYAIVAAPAMLQRYRLEPHASNAEWGNRILEVRGRVVLVGRSEKMGDFVMLQAGLRGYDPVICWMAVERPWDAIAPGMKVQIKGQALKIAPGSTPQLRHSWQVEGLESPESRTFAAEDLCRQYSENRGEVHDALSERWVWLTGQISTVDRINNALFLKGHKGTMVRCTLAGEDSAWDTNLDSGQTIQILGKIQDGNQRQVDFVDCLPPRRQQDLTDGQNATALSTQG